MRDAAGRGKSVVWLAASHNRNPARRCRRMRQ